MMLLILAFVDGLFVVAVNFGTSTVIIIIGITIAVPALVSIIVIE